MSQAPVDLESNVCVIRKRGLPDGNQAAILPYGAFIPGAPKRPRRRARGRTKAWGQARVGCVLGWVGGGLRRRRRLACAPLSNRSAHRRFRGQNFRSAPSLRRFLVSCARPECAPPPPHPFLPIGREAPFRRSKQTPPQPMRAARNGRFLVARRSNSPRRRASPPLSHEAFPLIRPSRRPYPSLLVFRRLGVFGSCALFPVLVSFGFLDRFPLFSVPLSKGFPATHVLASRLFPEGPDLAVRFTGIDGPAGMPCAKERLRESAGRFARTLGLSRL